MYMLVDNDQPLGCAFDCDTFAANQTIYDMRCNVGANGGLRLGFTLMTLLIVVILGLVLFCTAVCSDDADTDDIDGEEEDRSRPV